MEPPEVSVSWVNRPCTGSESTMAVGSTFAGACTHTGRQRTMSDHPEPVAPLAAQVDQAIPVTTFPEEALKTIRPGLIPA